MTDFVEHAKARLTRVEQQLPPRVQTVIALAGEAAEAFGRINPPALAAQVAYSLLFTMPAVALLVLALAALVERVAGFSVVDELRAAIVRQAPAEFRDLLLGLLDHAQPQIGAPTLGTLTTTGLALWWAAGGFGALAGACTQAYGTRDPRPLWKQQLIFVLGAFGLAALLVTAFVLFVFGETIRGWLTDRSGLVAGIELSPLLVRWPVVIALVFGALMLVYTVGTGVAQSPRWVVPAAALATIVWLLVVQGFEVYLRFVVPGSAYGAVGGVIVFLFFLYVSSLVFIGGAMITAVLGRHFDARAIADVAERGAPDGICPPPEDDEASDQD